MTRTYSKWPGGRRLMAMLVGAILLLPCACSDKGAGKTAVVQSKSGMESQYEDVTRPVSLEAEQVKADLEAVKDSLCFIRSQKDEVIDIAFDRFLVPNDEFADFHIEWTGAFTEKGENVLRAPTTTEIETEKSKKNSWTKKSWSWSTLFISDKNAKLVSVQGTLHLSIPTKFTSTILTADDIGKRKQLGSCTFTLRKFQDNEMGIDIPENSMIKDMGTLVIIPRDKTERTLRQTGGGCELRNGFYTGISKGTFGRIASIEIFYPSQTLDLTIPIVATSKPELAADYVALDNLPPGTTPPLFDKTKIRLPSPRYEERSLPTFVEMNETTLREQIKFSIDRIQTKTTEYSRLDVTVPRICNNYIAQLEFTDLELFDAKNRPIAYKKPLNKIIGLPRSSSSCPYTFTSSVNPEKTVDFSRVAGKLKIHYPAKLKMISLTADQPVMEDVEAIFWGQKVIIRSRDGKPSANLPISGPPSSSSFYYMVVPACYDAQGRRLAAMDATRNIFWGEPRAVKYFVVEKWIDLEIPYDLSTAAQAPAKGNKTK